MPEREFELYLSLLAKLLRLNPGQKVAITDEMRDHLEERLAELTGQGLSREDAIHRALDEFGDAAGIAADFSLISRQKRRRFLMRMTLGTVVATTAVLLIATAFWPAIPDAPAPNNALAQDNNKAISGAVPPSKPRRNTAIPVKPKTGTKPVASKPAISTEELEIEKKLATKLEGVQFEEVSLKDVIDFISESIKTDILYDIQYFDDLGVDPKDAKVNLVLNHTKISARTALELALKRAGAGDVAITYREGLIYLTNMEVDRKTMVYDCRNLLSAATTFPNSVMGSGSDFGPGGSGIPGGLGSAPGAGVGPSELAPGSAGPGGGAAAAKQRARALAAARAQAYRTAAEQSLIHVIQSTVRSTTWQDIDGDGATISTLNGILVVSANHEAHKEIQQLIDTLEQVTKNTPRRRGQRGMGASGMGSGFGPRRATPRTPGGFGSGSRADSPGSSHRGGFGPAAGTSNSGSGESAGGFVGGRPSKRN
ncbi:MAG: hypothetical protein Tsb009_29450 [Planctomycetaceae bacterium]